MSTELKQAFMEGFIEGFLAARKTGGEAPGTREAWEAQWDAWEAVRETGPRPDPYAALGPR